MALSDETSRRAFSTAVYKILATDRPTRRELNDLGRKAARRAGRGRAWRGSHIYTLLHGDKWPKYTISLQLFLAVCAIAEQTTGAVPLEHVHVYGRQVSSGAVVLAASRCCGVEGCPVEFVPAVPNQRYCSDRCARSAAAARRRAVRQRRRLLAACKGDGHTTMPETLSQPVGQGVGNACKPLCAGVENHTM